MQKVTEAQSTDDLVNLDKQVAELLGYTNLHYSKQWGRWFGVEAGDDVRETLPSYSRDCNAANEVLKTIPYEQKPVYIHVLKFEVLMSEEGVTEWDVHIATARDRMEAFVRYKTKMRQ